MADVKMPQLGESVTEGTIAKWLKQPGDRIQKYEPLCEVLTDKVNAEVPSDFEGTLNEIRVGEGETVPVGTIIAVIGEAGESPVLVTPSSKEGKSTVTVTHITFEASRASTAVADGTMSGERRGRYSPAVMRLIQEHRLNPDLIPGTGAGRRITRKDVLAFLESGKPAKEPVSLSPAIVTGERNEEGDTVLSITPIRKTIAQRMVESKHSAPHAWTMVEADVTNLVNYRESLKETFKQKEGISLTFLPFFIKAVVESLKEFPIINSTWADDKIIIKKRINISIAVATDDALFVPVIKDADRMSILGLAHAIHDLAKKARTGKLTPDDISGGTFTVNNTGAFGSILSQPIINSPQAAILSMESIVKRPVVLANDAIAIRSMMNLCLSLDHRILDGLVCGRFLAAVKSRLESFDGTNVNLF